MSSHGLVGVADAVAFLGRLTRLDPGALVRLRSVPRPSGAGPRVALWGRLPWQALATRTVGGPGPGDATVAAADLLAVLAGADPGAGGRAGGAAAAELPRRRDTDWRWPLPPDAGRIVETIAAEDLVRVGVAAAGVLRRVAARRRTDDRAIREALLDHIAVVVTDVDRDPVEIPQRLVQAVVRMGFLGPSTSPTTEPVRVCIAGQWAGLTAPYGTAWLRKVSDVELMPLHVHTNG